MVPNFRTSGKSGEGLANFFHIAHDLHKPTNGSVQTDTQRSRVCWWLFLGLGHGYMDVNIFLIRQNDVNHGHRLQLPQSTVNFIGRMPCSKNAEPAQWTAASGFILKMYPVLFFSVGHVASSQTCGQVFSCFSLPGRYDHIRPVLGCRDEFETSPVITSHACFGSFMA